MNLTIAAIRSGSDPSGPLPEGAFHRTLDTQLTCPKCDVTYSLIVDFEQSTDRFFEESSRSLLLMLNKAVFMGHGNNHRISHFETSGVVVRAVTARAVEPSPERGGITRAPESDRGSR